MFVFCANSKASATSYDFVESINFEASRYFLEAPNQNENIYINGVAYPFGNKILFVSNYYHDLKIGTEINDDINLISENSVSKQDLYMNDISILVDLAKCGKIDPWNIDIIDIYDKYCAKLSELEARNNLKYAGRASLFASILLKIKSNILDGIEASDFEPVEEEFEPYDPEFDPYEDAEQLKLSSSNVISFSEVLQRRTSTRLNRNRNVTLKDLIRHIEFYEELEKKRTLQNRLDRQKRRVKNYSRLSAHDIKNLAHEEYIESSVKILHENLIKIFEKEEKVELETLTLLGLDKISAYIALLFLSVESEFELQQDEFYSNLYVVKGKAPEIIEEGQSA